ncbi:Tab2/Atab2 family RNA-binding protein [Oxynema sp. CENA135]|uniref:Tab2/Atab2 family RNA-binding protein n=1 Tax=Oxynema sp. CENA135 TaxID=984206 RepID=UPI00190C152E|nr:Tab2/Atab2 family RNA-binding protein [Oxynema sp. CENA135]MBK4728636.1 Tab2/Atab2 family RNA-binding protein [Oxynema sp. CENA135]
MGKTWELDFYSKPILDENGKKLWEVLICESLCQPCSPEMTGFRYSKYYPSTEVNSIALGQAIEEAIAQVGEPPTQIRFFRRQMNNMITKACKDLGMASKPSRRTLTLLSWLEERSQQVYPHEPGYDEAAAKSTSVKMESLPPQRLPDALIGQKWAFVSLEAEAFADFNEWEIGFGEAFPILGDKSLVADLSPNTSIPGLIIFSSRALPMAAWISGIELAFLRFDGKEQPRLILETGPNESWILANINDRKTQKEAEAFEAAKTKASGVHFLAVQSDPNSESFAGFWLLREVELA